MDKLLKIASAGLILWKMYHEKKVYDAQMAEYKKQDEQYQNDNGQYLQDKADFLEKQEQSNTYMPVADDLLSGVTFQYYFYMRHWNYSETRARVVLEIKNTSNITYRFQDISVTPYIFGQKCDSYATTNKGKMIPAKSTVKIDEWEWSIKRASGEVVTRKQPYDGYTDDDVILLTGSEWDRLKDLLGENSAEEGGWYVLKNAPISFNILCKVSIQNANGREFSNTQSYNHRIDGNRKIYYTARGTY